MGNATSSGDKDSTKRLDNPVTDKFTERGESEVQNLRYAVSGMQGLRVTMEDKHIHCTNIPVEGREENCLDDHSIFAVFDGHGGGFTSSYLEQHFLSFFSRRKELKEYTILPKTGPKSRSDVNGILLLKQALVKTFKFLDEELIPIQKERHAAILEGKIAAPLSSVGDAKDSSQTATASYTDLGERSGSTCVVVLLTPSHILCANAGDSRALLRRQGKVLPLSFDHKPSDLREKLRVLEAGGIVKSKRIDGDLAVSRAFGDFSYKEFDEKIQSKKQKVIVNPDLTVYPRDVTGDQFIVLACDGVWDVATSDQCSQFVQNLLDEGETDLGNVCEEALDICLDRRSRDNMTMMVVSLPAMKVNTSSAAIMHNAMWGQRSSRQIRQFADWTRNMVKDGSCRGTGGDLLSVRYFFT